METILALTNDAKPMYHGSHVKTIINAHTKPQMRSKKVSRDQAFNSEASAFLMSKKGLERLTSGEHEFVNIEKIVRLALVGLSIPILSAAYDKI